jgi:hypothetical protein
MEAGAWWGKQMDDSELKTLQDKGRGGRLSSEEQARYSMLKQARAHRGISSDTMAGVRGNLSSAAAAQSNLNLREGTQSLIGPQAMQTVMAFDRAMSNLAGTMAPTINTALPVLTTTIATLGKTAVGVAETLMPALKAINKLLTTAGKRGLGNALLEGIGLKSTPEEKARKNYLLSRKDDLMKYYNKIGFLEAEKNVKMYISGKMNARDFSKHSGMSGVIE